MKRTVWLVAVIWGLLIVSNPVRGAELFGVGEISYSGGTVPAQSASSLPNLVETLVNNQGVFAPLQSQAFTANLTYFGIPSALQVQVNAAATQLTISSPLTGLNQVFTGTGSANLEDQLTDWLLEKGTDEVAKLLRAVAETAATGLTDGNPASATARMTDRAFRTFSFFNASSAMRGSNGGLYNAVWIHHSQSQADAPVGGIDTAETEIDLPWWLHFGESVSLIGNMVGQYRDTEGTEIYGVGGDIGLGIRLVPRGAEDDFGWQLTPYTGLYGLGSHDGATGGLLDHFGLSNRFEFKLTRDSSLIIANQFAYYDSLEIEIDNVKIDPDLEQMVVKNGIMLDVPAPWGTTIYHNFFVSDTRFLENAAIDNYQTAGAGFSIRDKKVSLNAYFSYDFTDLYEGWNAGLGLGWGH